MGKTPKHIDRRKTLRIAEARKAERRERRADVALQFAVAIVGSFVGGALVMLLEHLLYG